MSRFFGSNSEEVPVEKDVSFASTFRFKIFGISSVSEGGVPFKFLTQTSI